MRCRATMYLKKRRVNFSDSVSARTNSVELYGAMMVVLGVYVGHLHRWICSITTIVAHCTHAVLMWVP